MKKYKIFLALLCGAGFTSLMSLLLDRSILFAVFIMPGSVPAALLFKSQDAGPAPAVLVANSLVYAGLAFFPIDRYSRLAKLRTLRSLTLGLVAPVAILVVLACVPSLDPLWPSGMDSLAKTETTLASSFPNGMSAEEARAVLKSKGIDFSEMAGPTLVGKTDIGAL